MTPAEKFSPHYGAAVGRRVAAAAAGGAAAATGGRVGLVEVGAGTGTLAVDALRLLGPSVPYVSVEASAELAAAQVRRLAEVGGGGGGGGAQRQRRRRRGRRGRRRTRPRAGRSSAPTRVVGRRGTRRWRRLPTGGVAGRSTPTAAAATATATAAAAGAAAPSTSWRVRCSTTCRTTGCGGAATVPAGNSAGWCSPRRGSPTGWVWRGSPSPTRSSCAPWTCTGCGGRGGARGGGVAPPDGGDGDGALAAAHRWLRAALDGLLGAGGGGGGGGTAAAADVYVPTGAVATLTALARVLADGRRRAPPPHTANAPTTPWPFHTLCLTLADFTVLDGAVSGAGGPVVQRVVGGRAVTYASVEGAPAGGAVDVLFPTDFGGLAAATRAAFGAAASAGRRARVTTRVVRHAAFMDAYGVPPGGGGEGVRRAARGTGMTRRRPSSATPPCSSPRCRLGGRGGGTGRRRGEGRPVPLPPSDAAGRAPGASRARAGVGRPCRRGRHHSGAAACVTVTVVGGRRWLATPGRRLEHPVRSAQPRRHPWAQTSSGPSRVGTERREVAAANAQQGRVCSHSSARRLCPPPGRPSGTTPWARALQLGGAKRCSV
ncbi:hypothetical protein BU14_0483s0012 [Porphyra umbilicalis]|uniref:type II protein arginine methyltransferase n=1 Tax=Porphyra umbilicalis TaxID=2786 RepID=A0A1X6NTP6_PORUM|nr:hypothetical protein BU14_0483s0012 [Porphyra umbilicalis]|eukprot:OSX71999.1 hypothetical protein BU14_0483s0012 [Porphyra umbilicalis]